MRSQASDRGQYAQWIKRITQLRHAESGYAELGQTVLEETAGRPTNHGTETDLVLQRTTHFQHMGLSTTNIALGDDEQDMEGLRNQGGRQQQQIRRILGGEDASKGSGVPIRMTRLPAPCITAHALDIESCLPPKFAFGQGRVGVAAGHIASAAVHKTVGHRHSGDTCIDSEPAVGQEDVRPCPRDHGGRPRNADAGGGGDRAECRIGTSGGELQGQQGQAAGAFVGQSDVMLRARHHPGMHHGGRKHAIGRQTQSKVQR